MAQLRKAVNRLVVVAAECPVDAHCVIKEQINGEYRPVQCSFYAGLHGDERGLFVRCNYPDRCPS